MDTVQAILKINPAAKVSVIKKQGEEEVITWLDGTAEISTADIDAKKVEFTYVEPRDTQYPSLKEFAEAYTEKEILGDTTKWDEYVIKYNKVRSDNPK